MNKNNRVKDELDEALAEAKKPKTPTAKELSPERIALRDALAHAVRESNRLSAESQQSEQTVSGLRGTLSTLQTKLDEATALHRAQESRSNALIAQQTALAPLFLGASARSISNPEGMTLDDAYRRNFDGLKDVIDGGHA